MWDGGSIGVFIRGNEESGGVYRPYPGLSSGAKWGGLRCCQTMFKHGMRGSGGGAGRHGVRAGLRGIWNESK